jgi:hypothetical protein
MEPKQQDMGTLEIEQDLEHQRRSWTIQRLGWGVMALTILGALLGLFGTGPLSSTTTRSPDGVLALHYERFWRVQASMIVRLLLAPTSLREGEAHVWLSRAYLDSVSVEKVMPPPQRVEASPERLTYIFAIAPTSQPIEVRFTVEPQRPGRVAGQLGLANGTALRLAHFIYP